MNFFKIFCFLILLNGCGSAWVVDRDQMGGSIGYKGYSSSDAASAAVTKLIPCTRYEAVSDRLMDGGTTTSYIPIQTTNYSSGTVYGSYGSANYNGQQTQTNYVPYQTQNLWRLFTYRCLENTTASSVSESRDISSSSELKPLDIARRDSCWKSWEINKKLIEAKGQNELSFLQDCNQGRVEP
jgi:hypothetical protein